MCIAQRPHDLRLALFRVDGLEPQLGDPLLSPTLPDRRVGALASEERPRPFRVPGAPLVIADPPCAGREERVAYGVERLRRHEHDELPVHRLTLPQSRRVDPGPRLWFIRTTDTGGRFVSTTSTESRGALGQPRGVAFVV